MFSRKFAAPDCKQVKLALKRMGFEAQKQNSTSHIHFKKVVSGKLFKVTVDCPKAPFSNDLVKSMAKQAGVDKRTFLEYCHNKKKKDDPHK